MSIHIAHRRKGDKYFRIIFGHWAGLYLGVGLHSPLGFRLDIEQRCFSLHLPLIALYVFPWGQDGGEGWGDDDKNWAYGLEVTNTHLIYGHFHHTVFFIGYPWSLVHLYTKKLKPEGPGTFYIPVNSTREQLRRLPKKFWHIDHSGSVFIRTARWFYHRLFPKKVHPRWLKTSYQRTLLQSGNEGVQWWNLPVHQWELGYRYTLKSGRVQERTARLSISERGYCPWFLAWTDLPLIKYTSLDIDFSDEVGDQTGTWKGGVTGTSETMRRGETVYATFRRFERDRKF